MIFLKPNCEKQQLMFIFRYRIFLNVGGHATSSKVFLDFKICCKKKNRHCQVKENMNS